ncbi:MAG TPA: polysaccharide deacetylase family protein, partial [Chthoniobacteraceae bacterium]|nr:polysaccharide deacetylase family protein [Chthoniobacteraceae bacterium]
TMVRLVIAFSLIAFSVACAAPIAPSIAAAAATTTPPNAPTDTLPADANAPAPPGQPKTTYSQCHVEGPYIAMTFDDGPHVENTPRLLDMLKERGIKATFFVVGQCAAEYPQILKRIADEGHEIANHSWSHPQLSKMGEGSVTDQLQRTHDVITQTTGIAPKIMRPPYGAFTPNQRGWANHKWGYKIILWDVDPLDWKIRNADHVKSVILKDTVSGSIILSHDIHKTTIDAMPATLDGLAAKGFKFVTVSELISMDKPATPKPKASPAPKTPAAPGEAAPKSAESATPPPPAAAGAAKK